VSIVTDQKVKVLEGKIQQLEVMVKALKDIADAMKLKLDTIEALMVPRPKRIPRDPNSSAVNRDSTWVQPNIR
jgi:hypothetical protein